MKAKLGRRWLLAGLLTTLVAVGIFGGTVLARQAQSDPTPAVIAAGPSSHLGTGTTDILDRTAQKLGIDADELTTAFNEARTELRQETADSRLDALFDRLVENGTLTEEEAAEYRSWYETRPSFIPGSGFGFGGGTFRFGIDGSHGFEELENLFDGPRFRRFRGGAGFRFFFGPHGSEDGTSGGGIDETTEGAAQGASA